MHIELNNFCLSKDFESCLKVLKDKLKHQSQINVYDSIYIPFVKTISKEEEYWNIIIPGLEYFIKLLSLSLIYKKELFPNNERVLENEDFTEDDLLFIKESFDKQYTMKTFFQKMNKLIDLSYHLYDKAIDIEFSNKRICCVYILLHNAGSLSFSTAVNMLIGQNFTKSFFTGKIYSDSSGPHGGYFETPSMFFDHDFDHYMTTILAFNNYDISKLIKLRNSLSTDCLQKRFLNLFSQCYIFETNRYRFSLEPLGENYNNYDIMKEYPTFYENPFEIYDPNDHIYVIKYLLESFDLKLTEEEMLITSTLNDNYIFLKRGLRQSILNDSYLDEKTGEENMDFSYLDNFISQSEEIEDNKINGYYIDIINEMIIDNSMKIYNILKQYI